LPEDLFYNTGINTYIWFFTNKKKGDRIGKVQLINAVDFCKPSIKSLGNKRNDILEEHVLQVLKIYMDFEENEYCRIIPNNDFGQYELTIEQPLRDDNNNVVMRSGKIVADAKKRDTEKVSLDCNVKEYFSNEVLPHIDPKSWIDFSRTRTNYEINFSRYFYKHEELEVSSEIAKRILEREQRLTQMINSIFA
jgi:type I restriction enzyme M protein